VSSRNRTKDEIYRHLSVDIVSEKPEGEENETAISKASVEKSLKAFFQPEVREIKCEKCTDGTHASQTLRILSRYAMLSTVSYYMYYEASLTLNVSL